MKWLSGTSNRGAGSIKQHLRIKTFYGTNENAVKTQIWIAVCTYVLIAIAKTLASAQQSS
jgi:hypothetical protein